jgi:hypothetical protein
MRPLSYYNLNAARPRVQRFLSTPENHPDASRVGYRTELDR